MIIEWFGHSCFHIVGSNGISILTDPYDNRVGYRMPGVKVDVVSVSHDHTDHNNIKAIQGDPAVIRGPGIHFAAGTEFLGVATYHDKQAGTLRGKNTVFCFQIDGIRTCHLGDLGHVLREQDVKKIAAVDLLFVPVGGIYTIDARDADNVIKQLRPRIAVPMHYWTDVLSFELNPVNVFLDISTFQGPVKSLRIDSSNLTNSKTRVVLFEYISA
jgi:L-ascorbate metabolism protein UlaG (beta-lactamase superfamily)